MKIERYVCRETNPRLFMTSLVIFIFFTEPVYKSSKLHTTDFSIGAHFLTKLVDSRGLDIRTKEFGIPSNSDKKSAAQPVDNGVCPFKPFSPN